MRSTSTTESKDLYKGYAKGYASVAKAIEDGLLPGGIAYRPAADATALQRRFREWGGVTPEKFAHYISPQHIRRHLSATGSPLFGVRAPQRPTPSPRCGVEVEKMSADDYPGRDGASPLYYSYRQTPFGTLLVASVRQGICYVSFADDLKVARQKLEIYFPDVALSPRDVPEHDVWPRVCGSRTPSRPLKVCVRGSDFQLAVWRGLLRVPMGELVSYASLAARLQQPKTASRAVGAAIAGNPIALLLPCHRVVQSNGELGGYRWGLTRKRAMIGWEMARLDHNRGTTEPHMAP